MKIIIEHKNKLVEFYNVPGKIAKSIENLLNAISKEESNIVCSKTGKYGNPITMDKPMKEK